MELPAQLQYPAVDESRVERLAKLAATIDGARPGEWEDALKEFQDLSGIDTPFEEFQGVYGGMEHDEWVRNLLCLAYVNAVEKPSREEMLELIRRLSACEGEPHEQFFWLKVLERHLHPKASDLLYWPGEFFGDGKMDRELTPQEIYSAAENAT